MSDDIEVGDLNEEIPTEETLEESQDAESTEEKTEGQDEPEEEVDEEEELPAGRYPRPSVRDVKAKYPEFFKDFPDIKDAIFREHRYTEIFPTVDDAQEAQQKSETFDAIEQQVFSGDLSSLFKAVGDTNTTAVERLADNVLSALSRVDEKLYYRAVTPALQQFVRAMYQNGQRSGNKNLANSALHAMQFAGFEEEVLNENSNGSKRTASDPERQKFEEERNQFYSQKEQEARGIINADAFSALHNDVQKLVAGHKNLTPYERKAMVRELIEGVDEQMAKDSQHMGLMNSLWKRAQRANYNRESADRIKQAYLSRAKAILPTIHKQVRSAALKKTVEKSEQPEDKQNAVKVSGDKRVVSSGKNLDPKKIDWSKTSDEDYLNGKITLLKG